MESKERIVYDPTEDRAKAGGKAERKATEKKPEKPTEKASEKLQGSEKVFKCSMNRYNFIHLGKKILESLGWRPNENLHLEATVENGVLTLRIKSGTG